MTRLWVGVALCVALGVMACDWDGLRESNRDNVPPTVRITGGAVEGRDADYRVEFFWFGADADGTIDHFLYAIDDTTSSADPDSIWNRTDSYSGVFNFSATIGEPPPPNATQYYAADWHTFYVKAVDDRGAESPADRRYFNAITIAPTVKLLAPTGEGEEKAQTVSTFVTLRWEGRDEDSPEPDKKPYGYQMKLVDLTSIFETDGQVLQKIKGQDPVRNRLIPDAAIVPDSVEVGDDTYHAHDWWPKVSDPYRDELFRLQNLVTGNYAAGIRSVDVAGAILPDDDLEISNETNDGNIIKLKVSEEISVNPHLTITERNFLGQHTFYARGEAPWRVEVPVGVRLEFEWTATADWYGARTGPANWSLDIPDPGCEVCQSGTGIGGWIGWGSHDHVPFPITFGEQDAGEEHVLYVRVRDESNLPDREVMGVVIMDVVAFPFDRTALWVDDYNASGVTDCRHDAFVQPMLEEAITPFLEPGEELDQFGRVRIQTTCADGNDRPDPLLSIFGRYKLLFWNVNGGRSIAGKATNRSQQAEFGKNLAIYVRAGGNLIIWGKDTIAALLAPDETVDFFPPDSPYNPELPLYPNPNFGPGSFVWDILKLRTQMDRTERGVVRSLSLPCSGIIGMAVTEKAELDGFPAGILDPTGYSTRTAIWFNSYDRPMNPYGLSGVNGTTGLPPLRVAGMDTLYTFIPNSWTYEQAENAADTLRAVCGTSNGSPFKDNPMIIRYDDPVGAQGKVVWISTELYYFIDRNEAELHQLMNKLTEWIFE